MERNISLEKAIEYVGLKEGYQFPTVPASMTDIYCIPVCRPVPNHPMKCINLYTKLYRDVPTILGYIFFGFWLKSEYQTGIICTRSVFLSPTPSFFLTRPRLPSTLHLKSSRRCYFLGVDVPFLAS